MTSDSLNTTSAELVRTVLIDSPGVLLDDRTRSFMESRFGQDFRCVRVHTGPRAAKAAAALNARAFVYGRHVVFGQDQYRPDAPDGLRLLSHELTHVVQQRGGDRPHLPRHIGRADDPLEQEANLVAQRILTPARLPSLTRDDGEALRRKVVPVEGSAAVTVFKDNVKPDFAQEPINVLDPSGPRKVTNHLTNGFNAQNPLLSSDAFTFVDTVRVKMDPGDDVNKWKFGFVQFAKQLRGFLTYAGRKPGEGWIGVNTLKAIGESWFPDINESFKKTDRESPFYAPPSKTQTFTRDPDSLGGSARGIIGDHPLASYFGKILKNETTGPPNYLFNLWDTRLFCSIFTMQDDGGHFEALFHVLWLVEWNFSFRWELTGVAEIVKAKINASDFFTQTGPGFPSVATINTFRDSAIGPDEPVDDPQPLFSALTPTAVGPIYNDKLTSGINTALNPKKDFRLDMDDKKYPLPPAGIPDDFYQ
jgi:hypothetical protein